MKAVVFKLLDEFAEIGICPRFIKMKDIYYVPDIHEDVVLGTNSKRETVPTPIINKASLSQYELVKQLLKLALINEDVCESGVIILITQGLFIDIYPHGSTDINYSTTDDEGMRGRLRIYGKGELYIKLGSDKIITLGPLFPILVFKVVHNLELIGFNDCNSCDYCLESLINWVFDTKKSARK